MNYFFAVGLQKNQIVIVPQLPGDGEEEQNVKDASESMVLSHVQNLSTFKLHTSLCKIFT